mgnify:FL=1
MSLLDDHQPCAPGSPWWRSEPDRERAEAYRERLGREFPSDPCQMTSAFSRRAFLGLMAASASLAGMTGCRRPEEEIRPYSKMPENMVEGVPRYYATTLERAGEPIGVLAQDHEGRPVKLEGNPDHPSSGGALDPITQAATLELYDPDRSRFPRKDGKRISREAFEQFLDNLFGEDPTVGRGGLRFLCERTTSPVWAELRDRVLEQLPEAKFHYWEPIHDEPVLKGVRRISGRALRPRPDFGRADRIVALDADFLAEGPERLRSARAFATRRDPEATERCNRLYVLEPAFTLTGIAADHRAAVPAGRIPAVAAALAIELMMIRPEVADVLGDWTSPLGQAAETQTNSFMKEVARDLADHRGRAVVVAGPRQPAGVHALVALLNTWLAGACIEYVEPPEPVPGNLIESMTELATALRAGQVGKLIILGGNPAFDAPSDLAFASAIGEAGESLHLSFYFNETSALCRWHAPRAHALESWDVKVQPGGGSMSQPQIQPIFDGWSDLELLARIAGGALSRPYELVRDFYDRCAATMRSKGAEPVAWDRALERGLTHIVSAEIVSNKAVREMIERAGPQPITEMMHAHPAERTLELVVRPDPHLFDGRLANLGWLQEAPDPVTKLAWDNAAVMSPATARELGVANEDMVRVETDGRAVELPVWTLPGTADGSILTNLGYGRTRAGRVGNGHGVDVYPMLTTDSGHVLSGVRVAATGRRGELASVQDHWSLEGRPFVLEVEDEEYRRHPEKALPHKEHHPGAGQLWDPHDYTESPQWAMAIDLSRCIGCNACLLACQAENNIPIVGKQEVRNGREMHWIRVDRYFRGDPESPALEAVFQPLPCQHCENAPCESVCPVTATTHSPDGINEMTYNRCIGTRYCSNNCPFKVRRFNYLNYHGEVPVRYEGDRMPELKHMAMNPDVTVRMRGVMEKCTFCLQRIRRAGWQAKAEGRSRETGEVRTACQQACPTGAIRFGDLTDPDDPIRRVQENPRAYQLLPEYNLRTRVHYLGRLRNRNPRVGEM